MDDGPVIFASHWVFVTLAQKTHVVGVLELFNARRVASEALVVATNGAGILSAAVDQLFFLVSLNRNFGIGYRGGQGDDQQSKKKQKHQQDVAMFIFLLRTDVKTRLGNSYIHAYP